MLASKVKRKKKKEKAKRNTYNITSIKRVSRKIHVVVVQQQRQRNVKKVRCTCKVVFLLIRPFDYFSMPQLFSNYSIFFFGLSKLLAY